jgi:hypothetical protein
LRECRRSVGHSSPVTAPTEFHVYLALKHNKPIYVGTSVGDWVVEEGKVRFLKNRER